MEKWTPEEVERVSGPGRAAQARCKIFATEKPSTLIWAMGQTQHTVGTATRASCMLLLLTGNVGGRKGCQHFPWP